jgi:hypothetical protein
MRRWEDVLSADIPFVSRRREPRLAVGPGVSIVCLSDNVSGIEGLHDIGFRGFAITTAEAIAPGTRARFSFSSWGGPVLEADAVAIHCHRSIWRDGGWISGWEFPEQPDLDASIDRLIEQLTVDIAIP